ncbi:hypothetical protein ACWGRK_00540 [Saccharomonospora azurea]|uniref:Uncharacterized protein n=1 Tax=Saccharomonospora azurea NA-128 TaxID=882081 RepID=H8G405_9PSEU|nr:hypothetical protein [Saccharomonospora azurea]EHY90134.1 hypothetical protein SacazDRAFT_03257 [Saccharomonospora azurea NA-128]
MTRKVDSKLIEQLRQNQAALKARSAAIAEHGKQVTQKLAANTLENLQSMRKHAAEAKKRQAELDKQKDDEADPTAKNQWLQRREGGDDTFQFGQQDDDEAADVPAAKRAEENKPVAPPAPPPAPAPQTQQSAVSDPAPAARAKHRAPRPADDFDDDDFSNNSWLQ